MNTENLGGNVMDKIKNLLAPFVPIVEMIAVAIVITVVFFGSLIYFAPKLPIPTNETAFAYSPYYEGVIVKNNSDESIWLIANGTKSKIVNGTIYYIILYDRDQNAYFIIPDRINGVRYYRSDYAIGDFEKIPQGKDINLSNYLAKKEVK
jgi:hypothetical protein